MTKTHSTFLAASKALMMIHVQFALTIYVHIVSFAPLWGFGHPYPQWQEQLCAKKLPRKQTLKIHDAETQTYPHHKRHLKKDPKLFSGHTVSRLYGF